MNIQLPQIGHAIVDQQPDHRPVCQKGIQPIDMGTSWMKGSNLERVFRCPRKECERIFVSRHTGKVVGTTYNFALLESLPRTLALSTQPQNIQKISPDFASIFGEAEAAEQQGLKLVCGPGYRKALEFLIKDYAIRTHPDKADEIKKQLLAACINKYVTDTRVKQVAARAVWLGNDETHYFRKWEDKDLTDLKGLIKLTVHWIEMDELTKTALIEMPDGKK